MIRWSAFVLVAACHGADAVDAGVIDASVIDAGDVAIEDASDEKADVAEAATVAPEGMLWVPAGT
ncbi:MAG TPA: hypothetical protein VGI39_41565, partial [Polyangiaceae bacterium]